MNKYDRNKLYEEVWLEPVSTVADRYGVSNTALAKACRRLNVPLPPRGYWAKVKSGQPVTRPELPDPIPDKPSTASMDQNKGANMQNGLPRKRNKKTGRAVKKDIEYEPQERLKQQINVFMRHHMVEEEDIIHHFKYLISCLDHEEYENYPDGYKKRRTLFLEDCIKKIKEIHLPALLAPWTFYDCIESSSGFSVNICRVEKTDINDNEVEGEVLNELCNVIEMPYDLVAISEYAKLIQVDEKAIEQWISAGRLSGAQYEDGDWRIPELHSIPEDDEYPILMFFPEEHPDISSYPLLSYCDTLQIMPQGSKYSMILRSAESKWEGQLYITKKEKDALMGELLKQGFSHECAAYEMPYYPVKKHFDLNYDQWYEIPPCDEC